MDVKKTNELAIKISGVLNDPRFPVLPKIEYDLLMQNMRTLYEELSAYSPTNQTNNQPNPEQQPEELLLRRPFRPNQNLLLEDSTPPPAKQQPVKEEVVKTIKEEVIEQKQSEVAVVKEVAEVTTISPPVTKTIPSTRVSTINDSVQASSGSLNEKLRSQSKEVHKAISSKQLKDMIDLNKRFVFVSELFKGNKDEFTFAVTHIDEIADYTSAQAFITSQLISTHKWDENSATVKSFMELVRVKFGVE